MKRSKPFYDYVNQLDLTENEKQTLVELAETDTEIPTVYNDTDHDVEKQFKVIEDKWINWQDFDNVKLKALRTTSGHTRETLSEQLDLKRSRYDMIEKGLHRVRQSELVAICTHFEIHETTLHYKNAGIRNKQ